MNYLLLKRNLYTKFVKNRSVTLVSMNILLQTENRERGTKNRHAFLLQIPTPGGLKGTKFFLAHPKNFLPYSNICVLRHTGHIKINPYKQLFLSNLHKL